VLVNERDNNAARGGSVEGEKAAETGVPRWRNSNIGGCGERGVGKFDNGRLIHIGGHVVGGVGNDVEKAAKVGNVALWEREGLFTWGGYPYGWPGDDGR
jgi:hypothetical protein